MLYISRYISANRFGVVDTDDDSEENITTLDLYELVWQNHMKIEGVVPSARSLYIEPYQDERYVTGDMAKMKTLAGIEIRVWRNEITYVMLSGAQEGVRIELSRFGSKINWAVPTAIQGSVTACFVIDDSIRFIGTGNENKFPIKGISLDISAVSNVDRRAEIYLAMYSAFPHNSQLRKYAIIDDQKKFAACKEKYPKLRVF